MFGSNVISARRDKQVHRQIDMTSSVYVPCNKEEVEKTVLKKSEINI
jgi:hypothetical protein